MSAVTQATTKPTEEPETECPICITTYTKTVRRPVTCPTCHAESCIQCAQRYLTETAEDAHCMHCKARWGRRFLLTTFNKTWMDTDYQHHRAELLWRREESFLPATMPRVELIVRGRRAMEEVIKPMEERMKAKEAEAKTLLLALDKNYKGAEKEALQIQRELAEAKYPVQRMLRGEEPNPAHGGAGEPEKTKTEFHRKCMHDGCNGWLSTAWRCGVCENYTCATCYANKGRERDAGHTCKEEDKATVALLAKDTKPCPNCGMGVQRSEGCPVMFCTACHKGFNWNTLKVMETGIHNPHYFEWRNRGGAPVAPARTMGDIPCGGLPNEGWITYLPKAERIYISSMYRCIQHITDDWFMRQYRVDGIESLELRTKFLLGDSTKKTVQTALARQEKSNELKMALWDCYNTCAVAGSELLREISAHIEGATRAQNIQARLLTDHIYLVFNDTFPRSLYEAFQRDAEALRIFVNKAILSVAEVYRSTTGVQVIQSREGKPWNNFVPVETVLANELSKDSNSIRVMTVSGEKLSATDAKGTITHGQSHLLAETGFVWYKGEIVLPDAKILKRGAGGP
jgi:hypothetical protein